MKATRLPASLREGVRCVCTARPNLSKPALRRQAPSSTSRAFTTTSRSRIAAPPIRFPQEGPEGSEHRDRGQGRDGGEDQERRPTFYARVVPISPSYFTGQAAYIDNMLDLEAVARRYTKLPRVAQADAPTVAWRTLRDFRNILMSTVRSSQYLKLLKIVQDLNRIHPSVMPQEVSDILEVYKREVQPNTNRPVPIPIDQFGRALGVGKRKSSTARAWLVEGTGEVLINGKTLAEAFKRIHDRESAIWPLKATDRIDKYNVWALVQGGGTTGQAEALTLAVAKALMSHEPALKPALRRAGCVTRDPRRVERKKAGHLKARKKPAWVKR